jgi:ubiquinone/menaquinone biosynthesis C-methylase UbiE
MRRRDRLRARTLDWMMRRMDDLRAEALAAAEGDVLEVGFGTGLNLGFYPPAVKSVVGLDRVSIEGLPALAERLGRARFPVEPCTRRADRELPFDAGRFDCVVTSWTLCSIREPEAALAEMRRVLKPGGRYLFIEHGRAPSPSTARWQDRLNPLWRRLADGCNMNRPIDRLVEDAGFQLARLERFRHRGPAVLAHMFRGIATRTT